MEMHINAGTTSLPKVDVLEQRSDYIKSRSEYSNGFILISEIKAGEVTVMPNYNLIQHQDGTLTPDFNSPNSDFVDVY